MDDDAFSLAVRAMAKAKGITHAHAAQLCRTLDASEVATLARYHQGVVSDATVSDVAMSADEVATLYQAGVDTGTPNPMDSEPE